MKSLERQEMPVSIIKKEIEEVVNGFGLKLDKEVKNWLIKAFEDYEAIKHEINLPEDEIVTSVETWSK